MAEPYYIDEAVTLYHGDCREILPTLAPVDLILTDPPYGETSLEWDKWPNGWPSLCTRVAPSMWVFGSARMFDTYRDDLLADWRLSQDVIWSKGRGVGSVTDRFYRTHEHARHYYRGPWADVYRESPRIKVYGTRAPDVHRAETGIGWHGHRNATTWSDDGTRMQHSVIDIPGLHQHGGHPTQKPIGILDPLIRYACPPGGIVVDPFAGSGSTAEAARSLGRRSVLIEAQESFAERIAQRLSQSVLIAEESA